MRVICAGTVKYLTMKSVTWAPHVTVAAIIERDGRFLVIEEHTSAGLRINQPAGHLEAGETLVEAVVRETLEETAHRFEPEALVGTYMTHFERPGRGVTYLRFTFCGRSSGEESGRSLDAGIVRAMWLTADELRASASQHRTPLVMQCVDDYLSGRRVPLDFIHTHSVAPVVRS
ncbi:NUDIX domain-containing protein [Caballeronia arvi]|uniref:Phosphatase NudJ n=2 Tax=Caballeronia arvi TaxID=1777135 RepID=A0A158J7K4_9BURK|nr:NUDIX domain-containing protein [Caballeronia arvi]